MLVRNLILSLGLVVIAAGCTTLDPGMYVGVVAVDASGNLDTSFGEDGISLLRVGNSDQRACESILRGGIGVDAQRQIVTAGCIDGMFVATVRTEGGSPSSRFGIDGVAFGPQGAPRALAIARVENTEVTGFITAGESTSRSVDTDSEFRLAAFDFDGLDTSFGRLGVVTTLFRAASDGSISGIVIDSSDRILAAGSIDPGILALARYTPTGSLDVTFAADGRTVRPLRGGWRRSWVGGVALDSFGRIIVGGHFSFSRAPGTSDSSFFVTRYAANGNPDGRFGRFGITETDVPVDSGAEFSYDLEVLSDNRIVLCGSQPSHPFDTASLVFLLRYDTSGVLDPSLDGDGIVAFGWPRPRLSNCLALDILAGNDMLVTGYGSSPLDTSVLLSRFRADGTLDTSYGVGGATEISAVEVCAAFDCDTSDVRLRPGSLDTVVRRGVSYTSFLVDVATR